MAVTVLLDLRPLFGSARDQGVRPTCLAFAASDAHAAARGLPTDLLSVEWAYYHAVRRDAGRPGDGSTLGGMLDGIRLDGQPVETAWPYSARSDPDPASWAPPPGVTKLFRRDAAVRDPCRMDDVVATIAAGTPSLLVMTISDAFYVPGRDGVVAAEEPTDPGRVHAVLALGHGSLAGGAGALLVRNSWGPEWGRGRPCLAGRGVFGAAPPAFGRDDGGGCVTYVPIKTQRSCARAWLAASEAVTAAGGEASNVVIDIADPLAEDRLDTAIIGTVDRFLRDHGRFPVATVANTIFPSAFAGGRSAAQLYADYPALLDRMRRATRDWGRYFDRMIRWPNPGGGTVNQLDRIVRKVKRQHVSGRAFSSIYGVAIHDPTRDTRWRGGPCLSSLNFERDGGRLALTASYRNHHYVARCLGNLIGLGRLLEFVAVEAGLGVGPLTCVSIHAEIDNGTQRIAEGVRCGWTGSEAGNLIGCCMRTRDHWQNGIT